MVSNNTITVNKTQEFIIKVGMKKQFDNTPRKTERKTPIDLLLNNVEYPPFKPEISERSRQLAKKSNIKERNKQKFKKSVMERVFDEEYQKDCESSIEVQHNPEELRQRVDKFIERQQFKIQQAKILKQMQEFCQFNCIRQGFH